MSKVLVSDEQGGQNCLVCSEERTAIIGKRGNREYFGADQEAEPHLRTDVVKCLNCGFIYVLPRIAKTAVLEKEYYNDPAKYEAVTGGTSENMFRQRLSLIEKYKSPAKLLDVGAGKGEFLVEATKNGWESSGIEPSSEFCKYAQSRFQLKLFNCHLNEYETKSDAKYDVITLNHVLEHVEQPYVLLKSIRNLLDESGVLFIEVPNTVSNILKLADRYFTMKGLNWSSRLSPMHPPFHEFGYNLQSLKHLMTQSGYVILEHRTFSGRDRGYSKYNSYGGPVPMLRNVAGWILDLFGNRELICIIAKKIGKSE